LVVVAAFILRMNMQYTNFLESKIRICRQATKQQRYFVVLADENPRGENREVLLMAGRQGKSQVPLIYGDPDTVRSIVGSVLCRIRDNELCGVIGFASDPAAQQVRDKYLNGELECSLITKPIAGVQLSRGEQFHHVVGPAVVLTEWSPIQVVLS
jgi:hypothetical protein